MRTRFLLDQLLRKAGIAPNQINGYEQGEYTHAAVVAYVASGMADAALGVEPPARHFGLDFVPVASERYFLLCNEPSLAKPQFKVLLNVLQGDGFSEAVNRLPGYVAAGTGQVAALREAFAGFKGGSECPRPHGYLDGPVESPKISYAGTARNSHTLLTCWESMR